jgi:hypothetical protein
VESKVNLIHLSSFENEGYQLINVTYSGDKIIAKKVTGQSCIQRGETVFYADLSPPKADSNSLLPIELSSESAEKWGISSLSRYAGKGLSSSPNSRAATFVEGQFIMFDNYFSFLWVPTRQHVFFGRPSPEMVIDLLRDTISKEDELNNMRQHLELCLELDWTTSIARTLSDIGNESFRRISRNEDIKKMHKENSSSAQFGFSQIFNVQKWKDYLDSVLNGGDTSK